ncbi:JmjC domain protein [Oesophagostomum dentatum]|uniref:JmjC domain protein n=1 Tax=Oesophagostomum dentatum TaxID=61180 RepID=A0A0B1SBU8_OESDE|nr:JmjC domain protein [Oesophagostomum dentatum]
MNWSFSYLNQVLSHRIVPVEQGSRYTDANWAQKLMTGSEFFNSCFLPIDEKGPLYLAQHRLFNQVLKLCDDIALPHYCDHYEVKVDKNCWIGPGGTISPLHTDPRDNVFSQIVGRKFFRLVSPEESDKVYAMKDGLLTNTSQVDVLNPDFEKFPEFANAKCWDGVVEPGDVLFIPKKWWHLVASLTNSIAIAFWFGQ